MSAKSGQLHCGVRGGFLLLVLGDLRCAACSIDADLARHHPAVGGHDWRYRPAGQALELPSSLLLKPLKAEFDHQSISPGSGHDLESQLPLTRVAVGSRRSASCSVKRQTDLCRCPHSSRIIQNQNSMFFIWICWPLGSSRGEPALETFWYGFGKVAPRRIHPFSDSQRPADGRHGRREAAVDCQGFSNGSASLLEAGGSRRTSRSTQGAAVQNRSLPGADSKAPTRVRASQAEVWPPT